MTTIISSIKTLIVCTTCKTSYNVLSHSHWGLGQFSGVAGSLKLRGGEGVVISRLVVISSESPDFRSPEVGISALM